MSQQAAPFSILIEQCVARIGYRDEAEKQQIIDMVQKKLNEIQSIQNLTDELLLHLSSEWPGEQLISDWCRDTLNSKNFDAIHFTPLKNLARCLDHLAQTDTPLIGFPFDTVGIRVTDQKICLAVPRFRLFLFERNQNRLNNYLQQSGKAFIHPQLIRKIDRGTDFTTVIAYSFAQFLVEQFLEVTGKSIQEIQNNLSRIRHQKHNLPPDLPDYFIQIFQNSLKEPAKQSCEAQVNELVRHFTHNPFDCHSTVNFALTHTHFAYSVSGLYKTPYANEDRYFVDALNERVTVLLVADGVSTADLGSGETAAEETIRQYRYFFRTELRKLADEIVGSPAAIQSWPPKHRN